MIMPRPVSTAQSTLPLRWYWIASALGSGPPRCQAGALKLLSPAAATEPRTGEYHHRSPSPWSLMSATLTSRSRWKKLAFGSATHFTRQTCVRSSGFLRCWDWLESSLV